MTWLAPLGFLGFLGLVALIVIYIIKPNYQQKVISSTFIWKLSLKYKKKRLPLNRLNNILLFICQCMIFTICALLLAQPVLTSEKMGDENEKVIILDASASMMVEDGGITRFDRAVEQVSDMVTSTVEDGGLVSVVLADAQPKFLIQRSSSQDRDSIDQVLASLADGGVTCSYGSANMDSAVALAEEVLLYNNEAQVVLFTATNYLEKNGIIVEDVSSENEWNAAILGCNAKLNESNHYEILVDVGCFGITTQLDVNVQIHGINGTKNSETFMVTEFFDPTEEKKTVVFNNDNFNGLKLYSFEELEVFVSVDDSFLDDNSFFLYGGKKPQIKVQYASSVPNNYFAGMVRSMRETMKDNWDIKFVELDADEKAATEGFDLYIFEHRMPEVMPTDGVVLLVDPNSAPDGLGMHFGQVVPVDSASTLATGNTSDLMKYVDCNRITIARYRQIMSNDGFEELAYYNGSPVILAKDDGNAKVVVWAFDLNYSNLCAMPDFAFMMYNMFNYYIPSTMTSNSFEIGETVELSGRGTELKVTGNGEEHLFENAEGQITVNVPGTYTVTQKPMQGEHLLIENFFVKIPSYESEITKDVDALPLMNVDRKVEFKYDDLLFYFAIALVAFMFAEWYLHSRKNY